MAANPNPVASTTPVDGRPGMVQDWSANGQPYGQPHPKSNPNLDSAYGAPTASPVQTHKTTGGVLGGAHMGGHSDVAKKLNVSQLPNPKKSKK